MKRGEYMPVLKELLNLYHLAGIPAIALVPKEDVVPPDTYAIRVRILGYESATLRGNATAHRQTIIKLSH